ncbi:MAG: ComF family protein [Oscillospiraceae bacterium]|jgi:ComF family protein|nr:ComF family protein [Oscillospiraceae bacterium]
MRFLTWFLDLLFPPKCVFCRKILDSGREPVCGACDGGLPRLSGGGARTHGDYFDVCVSPLPYEGAVREAILRYKFNGLREYAETFGKILASCVLENLSGEFDVITWVPLSKKRLKTRGYNQAELLAEIVARESGKPAEALLEKIREAPAQSSVKGADARRANISGAFAAVSEPNGRRVLLVDDIVTTGATLSEAARTLLLADAACVVCAALAKRN